MNLMNQKELEQLNITLQLERQKQIALNKKRAAEILLNIKFSLGSQVTSVTTRKENE